MDLKLQRCAIRDWRVSDAESLAKHANNRKVSINLRDRFPYPYRMENARSFIERAITKGQERSHCIEINGSAVGGIGITIGEDVHRLSAEMGYWLAEEFWGQGIMSEVVPAFVNHCFAKFSLKRIYATTYASNTASARVLEKAGFQLEGRLHKHVIKDGQILDSLLYAKTN